MAGKLPLNLKKAGKAFNYVRDELREVGLLSDGKYLDIIGLKLKLLPSFFNEAGCVFDEGVTTWHKFLGFEEGVIYLPRNIPHSLYVPGGTLVDVIRHEFAHAWAWLDREYIDAKWFTEAFGGYYSDAGKLGSEFDRNDFFSEYAMRNRKEDFAETFMCFLRYRGSLGRFKNRPGLYRKLKGVEGAVQSCPLLIHQISPRKTSQRRSCEHRKISSVGRRGY